MKDESETAIETTEISTVDSTLTRGLPLLDLIASAKSSPRSVYRCLSEAESLACLNEDVAATMYYTLKRGGKFIEGPSVRLSEVMMHAWGNMLTDVKITGEYREFIEATATAFDLERITGAQSVARRRVVDKHGVRYGVDMIGVTTMAAQAVAARNARFAVIPRSYVDQIYGLARAASVKGAKGATIAQRRAEAVKYFGGLGITEAQLCTILEVPGITDVGIEELTRLRGIVTALKDGETTVDELLGKHEKSAGAEALNRELKDEDGDVPY